MKDVKEKNFQEIEIEVDYETEYPAEALDVFINDIYVGSKQGLPLKFSFIPKDIENIGGTNELRVILRDKVYNKGEAIMNFEVDI